jgi:hypothetical protein
MVISTTAGARVVIQVRWAGVREAVLFMAFPKVETDASAGSAR